MPKLPKGMFKRGPSYYVRLRVNGKDAWRSLGSEFGEACCQLSMIRAGEASLGDRTTVSEAAKRWLSTYVATARSEKNQITTAVRVTRYLDPFFVYVPMVRVGPDHVRRYRLWLEGHPISATTVWHVLSDARCLFGWCEEVGLVSRSPFPRRVMPRLQERPPDRLTDEEAARVLAIPEPHGFVVRLALGTGLRWSELTRAQASDVEGGMLVVSQTKSGKVRRVPLSPEMLREVRGRVGRLAGYSWKSPGSFAKAVRRATGLEGFHVHQLRHTFACQWIERGGSLAALQQILGHASVVTTQRYARLTDEAVRKEADLMYGGSNGRER
jgi:integrase